MLSWGQDPEADNALPHRTRRLGAQTARNTPAFSEPGDRGALQGQPPAVSDEGSEALGGEKVQSLPCKNWRTLSTAVLCAPALGPAAYFSLLARRRYSPTVMAFFWMLYCVKRPDWPVTTCWMGAGMTTSSMSSYVCRGFHSFGGMI